MPSPNQPLIFLGAGGHAKVLLAMTQLLGLQVKGVCCPELVEKKQQSWQGVAVLGADEQLDLFDPTQYLLVNAVGFMPGSTLRHRLFSQAKAKGFQFAQLIHPHAFVDPQAVVGEGCQIMAGAVVQVHARLADNCIINSNATVEHDCILGLSTHIAPGATLCGAVVTGDQVFVGANATLIQQVNVGDGAVIAAGAVVVKRVEAGSVYGRMASRSGEQNETK